MTALPDTPPSSPSYGGASAGRPSSSLHFVVGEMSGKLDQIMASILPQLAELKAADAAIDQRLTALERFQWIILGIVSAGGALWAVVEGSGLLHLIRIAPA